MFLYLRWLICCPNVALGGKSCSKLLVAQKVAQNSKSCQNVAKHNLYRPRQNPPPPPPGKTVSGLYRESYRKSVNYDRPDECSPEKNCVWWLRFVAKKRSGQSSVWGEGRGGKVFLRWREIEKNAGLSRLYQLVSVRDGSLNLFDHCDSSRN